MKRFTSRKGLTLVETMIVVLILGILLAIVVPNFIKARESSHKTTCIANMKMIAEARDKLAAEKGWSESHPYSMEDLVPKYLKEEPKCPSGGTYELGTIGQRPDCSLKKHELP